MPDALKDAMDRAGCISVHYDTPRACVVLDRLPREWRACQFALGSSVVYLREVVRGDTAWTVRAGRVVVYGSAARTLIAALDLGAYPRGNAPRYGRMVTMGDQTLFEILPEKATL